ncbi:uncharacterized protein LOC116345469 [Contarinia nasturtii]|uniref:uncharacterized protein LOC116345469 n=1 Tax=Contarinia nasturtii TaxID=265458 RepID=UPI0012D47E2D|nr:uncharacterized protein LOC116345469 [Contarinia nasturtii]
MKLIIFCVFTIQLTTNIVMAGPRSGPLCGLLCGLEKFFNPISPDPPFYQFIQLPNVTAEREDIEEAEGNGLYFVNFMMDCAAKPDIDFLKKRATREYDKSVKLPWNQLPGTYPDLSNIVDEINKISKSFESAANSRAGYKNYNVDKVSLQIFVGALKKLYTNSNRDVLRQQSINLVCRDLHTLILYMKALYKRPKSKTIGAANVKATINYSDHYD